MDGLGNKYRIEKQCSACSGTGFVMSEPLPNGHGEGCAECGGSGYVPVDPDRWYFVLSPATDVHAWRAAWAYSESVAADNERFATELQHMLASLPGGGGRVLIYSQHYGGYLTHRGHIVAGVAEAGLFRITDAPQVMADWRNANGGPSARFEVRNPGRVYMAEAARLQARLDTLTRRLREVEQ